MAEQLNPDFPYAEIKSPEAQQRDEAFLNGAQFSLAPGEKVTLGSEKNDLAPTSDKDLLHYGARYELNHDGTSHKLVASNAKDGRQSWVYRNTAAQGELPVFKQLTLVSQQEFGEAELSLADSAVGRSGENRTQFVQLELQNGDVISIDPSGDMAGSVRVKRSEDTQGNVTWEIESLEKAQEKVTEAMSAEMPTTSEVQPVPEQAVPSRVDALFTPKPIETAPAFPGLAEEQPKKPDAFPPLSSLEP